MKVSLLEWMWENFGMSQAFSRERSLPDMSASRAVLGLDLISSTARKLETLSLFRLLAGRIPCHHRDGSGGQNHVLQQELPHQEEHGKACHPWRNHENRQRSGKQRQGEQRGIAHP